MTWTTLRFIATAITYLSLAISSYGYSAGKDLNGVALIPGWYWGQEESGYEASLLYFINDFGAVSNFGAVYGHSKDGPTVQYWEAQAGGGIIIAGFNLGVGAYKLEANPYKPQVTFTFQILPVFFFTRWRDEANFKEYGMMIKIPIPASRRYKDDKSDGIWHFGFS
jgi:hypothetical protein